jgi:CBS domain-containing protein
MALDTDTGNAVLVGQLVESHGRRVVSILPEDSARTAASCMRDNRVGCLVVLQNGQRFVGLLTERDLVRNVLAGGADPDASSVRDVMTSSVIACTTKTPVSRARETMLARDFRHLPVMEGQNLVGVISIRDILAVRDTPRNHQAPADLRTPAPPF